MAVSDTITAINSAVQDAKNAVVAKGGTVGNTGLAGLADEINTISGGGGSEELLWGKVWVAPYTTTYSVQAEELEVELTDHTKLDNWILENKYPDTMLSFITEDGETWQFENEWGFEWSGSTADLESTFGITVNGTVTDPEMSGIGVELQFEVDEEGAYTSYTCQTEKEFTQLAKDPEKEQLAWMLSFDEVMLPRAGIRGVQIGSRPTVLGDYFLQMAHLSMPLYIPENVTSIGYQALYGASIQEINGLEHVTSLGSDFLKNAKVYGGVLNFENIESWGTSYTPFVGSGEMELNCPIVLGKEVPVSFLSGVTKFNSPIIFKGTEKIEPGFLDGCNSFNQPLNLEGITISAGRFMRNCWAFNQPLHFTSTTTIISESYPGFMRNTNNFVGPLIVDCEGLPNVSSETNDGTTLTVSNPDSPSYKEGVKIMGSKAQAWKDFYQNKTGPVYRKLQILTSE